MSTTVFAVNQTPAPITLRQLRSTVPGSGSIDLRLKNTDNEIQTDRELLEHITIGNIILTVDGNALDQATSLNWQSDPGFSTLTELNSKLQDGSALDDASDPRTPLGHAASHINGAGDQIDGDNLNVTFSPTYYTAASPTLVAHLSAIDTKFTDDRTADGIRTATTIVAVSSATAPTTGQVLTATSSTAANWQTPSGGGGNRVSHNQAVGTTQSPTKTGTEYTLIPQMTVTLTPASASNGIRISFNGTFSVDHNKEEARIQIYIDGNPEAATTRQVTVSHDKDFVHLSVEKEVNLSVASHTIEIRWSVTDEATITAEDYDRILIVDEIAA